MSLDLDAIRKSFEEQEEHLRVCEWGSYGDCADPAHDADAARDVARELLAEVERLRRLASIDAAELDATKRHADARIKAIASSWITGDAG